jgi:hypothetical protein
LKIHTEAELHEAQDRINQNMVWFLGLETDVEKLIAAKINKDMLW